MLLEFGAALADTKAGRHRKWMDSRGDKPVAAIFLLHDPGRPILEFAIQAFGPQSGGFHYVGISGHDMGSHF
jgi:hypothetical protein